MTARRIAIVLFNLGGPDAPGAVAPFLFNLFNDRAIINLPQPFRWLLANLIAMRRAPIAAHVYEQMGGRSPILPNTQAQADALTAALKDLGTVETFIAMRYWHPLTAETVAAVKAFAPDEIVLLPLYPQYSTTTTASSLRVWREEARRQGLGGKTRVVNCYPAEPGFIAALSSATAGAIAAAKSAAPAASRAIIFSAHGLPQKIVDGGDPYVDQVKATVRAVAAELQLPDSDWQLAFQSRVGPLKWVGPATDEVIEKAARAKKAIVVVPVAFVSEHSETLVELDIEYGALAKENGASAYCRAPTVATDPAFIAGLATLTRQALAQSTPVHGCGRTTGDLTQCLPPKKG